ncbi:venom allergen 3-like isoform X2 [Pectinophora gossypiella]|uniref:venom allergen 3-like isoform X1 n=1 Tax=Pectinophora gossypiella TaxID=13191 RepID=UPI00214F108D|nr:venom allergen 3-like isoform X1 [Pectinophora gossypiella]XP_049869982.1 venom allergen 3-like isoform X2 [Pectinophora gossypiella]
MALFRAIIILVCLGLIEAKLLKLTCKEIHQFVDGHNSRRLQVAKGELKDQPAASEMKSVVWDKELATKAARWASRNKFEHNPDKTIPSGRFKTGENLYLFSTTGKGYVFNPNPSMVNWFEEHHQWTYNDLKTSDFRTPMPIGHYTQMVWSNSTYIGCGVSEFQQSNWIKYLVVCNYGPAGNIIGHTPYPAGRGTGQLTCGAKNCNRPYGGC